MRLRILFKSSPNPIFVYSRCILLYFGVFPIFTVFSVFFIIQQNTEEYTSKIQKNEKIGLGGVFDLWTRTNTLTKKNTNLNISKYIINTKK